MAPSFKRQGNYDALRALSCITVVLLHVSSIYVKDEFRTIISHSDFVIGVFLRVLSNMAVPSFVMMSGAFLINEKNKNVRTFYKKAFRRIIMPTLVFSLLYVIMHYLETAVALRFGMMNDDNIEKELLLPLVNWVHGVPNVTMWFMYMMVGLYAVTPMICWFKEQLDVKTFNSIGVLLFVLCVFISKNCSLIWPVQWTEWIGYFVLGNSIYDYYRSKNLFNGNRAISIGLIAVAYMIQIVYWYHYDYNTEIITIPESFSLSVLVGSVFQFIGFSVLKGMKIRQSTVYISKYSMEIYLIHPFFVEGILQIGGRIIKKFPSGWLIPVITVVITILCALIADFSSRIIKDKT